MAPIVLDSSAPMKDFHLYFKKLKSPLTMTISASSTQRNNVGKGFVLTVELLKF